MNLSIDLQQDKTFFLNVKEIAAIRCGEKYTEIQDDGLPSQVSGSKTLSLKRDLHGVVGTGADQMVFHLGQRRATPTPAPKRIRKVPSQSTVMPGFMLTSAIKAGGVV